MKKLTLSLFGLLSFCFYLPGEVSAAPLTLSDVPLSVSTTVKPNVMLLVDNSGSMENITWVDSYNNALTYTDWSGGSWTSANGNVQYSSLPQGTCSNGWKRGTSGGVTKCLKLPPVTRYSGNYLNYLFSTYASGQDLTTGMIPTDDRMTVARNVANNLVTNNATQMRLGVSTFNFQDGGKISATCGSTTTQLTTAINALTASNWTPLSESLYEVTRYFRGLSSQYNAGITYTSPIQYRCQKNFTIVITDGMPTYDNGLPTNDPDDVADTTRSLPNWDGLAPTTTQAMYPNFPQYSDGFKPSGSESDEGYTLYLDDVAKFAWDIDFKQTGTDTAGGSYQDPKFTQQNMYTYTVGFATANQMLQDAAAYGHGEYYTANNAAQLTSVLQQALTDILAKSGSSAAATANAGFIGTNTKVYQARFNSADWSGQLLAFAIDSNTSSATYGQPLTNGPGPSGSLWDAGSNSKMPTYTNRRIFTIKDDATNTTTGFRGIRFNWGILTASPNPTFLNVNLQSLLGNTNVLEYLRGNPALEVSNGGTYRNRATRLGDIVYSAPTFVGAPSARYPDNLESSAYSSFKSSTSMQNRTKIIYVGANDGMLHGFDAETGVEQMAYVPGKVFGNLSLLASPTYSHRYYVDGSPTIIDAFIGGAWKTVLVGGFNKGGQGIYALDVTNPTTTFSSESDANAASLVMWEFTDYNPTSTSRGDADLGYTYSQPAIVRMKPAANGPWVAVFGNGYNNTEADGHASTTGNAVLYIVNLQTGALIKKIDTGVGTAQDPTGTSRPNGLATVAPADIDGDSIADVIYAGDLFGNLWKFDVSNNNSANWDVFRVSGTPTPLFTACAADPCTATNHQPITTRPSVGRHPTGQGVVVYFGTGKFLETTEGYGSAGGKQTFYAIWDNNAVVSGRSVLQQQSITTEGIYTFTDPNGGSVTQQLRVTSDNTINWGTQKGWYLDLVPPSGTLQGERQVTNSILRSGRIIFTTLIPTNTDPCNPGGQSWLMELNAENGSRLGYSPLDLNKDKQFSSGDYVTVNSVQVPVSGQKLTGGAATTPSPMAAEETEMKYISTAEGLETVMENPGPMDTGRQTWQQIGQ